MNGPRQSPCFWLDLTRHCGRWPDRLSGDRQWPDNHDLTNGAPTPLRTVLIRRAFVARQRLLLVSLEAGGASRVLLHTDSRNQLHWRCAIEFRQEFPHLGRDLIGAMFSRKLVG